VTDPDGNSHTADPNGRHRTRPRRSRRRWLIGLASTAVVVAVVANAGDDETGPTAATTTTPVTPSSPPPAAPPIVATTVIDGDTIEVSTGATVRLIGIDAPESGTCGDAEATAMLTDLVLGATVSLVSAGPGRDDVDSYDRLLRYVDVDVADAGQTLLAAGLAVPRYDSTDGYGEHPREAAYYAAAEPLMTCEPEPATEPEPAPESNEPWNQPGPDLDCADIGHPVTITGPDYHRLDRDGDGVACEAS
jgi:endonuclease YncB( thermonuclease family)